MKSMFGAKFVNIFKHDDLFFGVTFLLQHSCTVLQAEKDLPSTRKQTIVIYSISLHNNLIFRHASNLVDYFDHIPSAFHIDIIYLFNFLTPFLYW